MNDRCRRMVPAVAVIGGINLLIPPASPAAEDDRFLKVVRRYADTMMERVHDKYGDQQSMLLMSAFDRSKMAPLTTRPYAPGGARRGDRAGTPWQPLTGANPHVDENLLRVLYTLTGLTGDARYAKAADDGLKWFLENTQSPVTGLFPWGEHLSWNVIEDKAISGGVDLTHEFARPWVLWDRSYELAPEPCKRFALGLWEHQIADHKTGGFDRHAPYDRHGPVDGKDFARHGAFYVLTWGYAYKHTKEDVFLTAIDTIVSRFERKRTDKEGNEVATMGPLDVATAATLVPDPLRARLLAFADKEDELMLADLKPKSDEPRFPPTWEAGYSSGVSASQAMYYLARYEQAQKPAHRDLVVEIADAYLDALPEEDTDVWPMSFGHIISTEVAAYRFTGRERYLDQARRHADLAVKLYWQDNPLPRASLKTGHYEALSGPDTLALALLDLHAAANKLDTDIPSNTIDR